MLPAPAIPDRPIVLLTGFGPFPTVPANATSILMPQIADATQRAVPGISVAAYILPTEWDASLGLLDELTGRLRPTLALHFGVSGRASGFEIETRARNLCSPSLDAAGRLPADRCLSPKGPEFLASTLPTAFIVERLRRKGLPAQLSRDAGGYLCNALMYRSLENARAYGIPVKSGFVHLPASLVNERRPRVEPHLGRRLGWADVIAGSVEIVCAALGRTQPVAAQSGGILAGTTTTTLHGSTA
jgi:pyroglutamyl-peptidase